MKLKALCLAPSRELARQIMSVVVAMGKFTNVQTEYAIKENLPRNATTITAHIIVGTPGTMTDLMRRKVRHRLLDPPRYVSNWGKMQVIDVSEVKVFVLDEADNMLDQDGLGDQTLRIKKQVFCYFTIAKHPQYHYKHASSQPPCPNHSLLRYVPRPSPNIRLEICSKRQQDRASEGRTQC
jgi:DEAD/DEAH box helicase